MYSQGGTCITSVEFCTDFGYTYASELDSSAEVGPDYGCMATQLNVQWFHFQITQPGDLELSITNTDGFGTGYDVDFVVYGPFGDQFTPCTAQLTAANIVDCSYSTGTIEVSNLINTNIGEYYLMAISNFSNTPTDISMNQTGGIAAASCININDCFGYFDNSNTAQCDSLSNSYNYQGDFIAFNTPTTGELIIKNCNGDSLIFSAPFSDTTSFSFSGNSSGGNCSLLAYFTDSLQCSSNGTYLIPSGCICNSTGYNFNLTANVQNTCTSDCFGEVSVTPIGGVSPYSYSWQNFPNDTSSVLDSLCVGAYSVVVTDSNGCVLQMDTTVIPSYSIDNISVSSCDSATNYYLLTGDFISNSAPSSGLLIVYTSNGDTLIYSSPFSDTTSFTFASSSLGQISSVSAYFTDNSNCEIEQMFVEPVLCNCNASIYNFSLSPIDGVTCLGNCVGEASVSVTGGTPPYQYTWYDPFFQTTAIANNLCVGDYFVEVTDSLGCSLTENVIIDTASVSNNYSISGTQSIVSGGSVPICVNDTAGVIQSYLWSTGEQSQCILVSPTQTSYYTVQISFCGGNITDSVLVLVDSVNNILSSSIAIQTLIFPNPATDELNLKIDITRDFTADVVIIDGVGRLLLTNPLKLTKGKNFHKIDLGSAGISSGLYYLKIRTKEGESIKTFVVK